MLAGSDDVDWYKDAVIYELYVRAFADSDADGRGDFKGLTAHLDYIQQLGITAIWLLPFYPSPLRDDGYDTSDFSGIHPDLGTIADFRTFVEQAHQRGIRVITELVFNHTSDQHAWFQRARRAPKGSYWRNYYVWGDDPSRFSGVRIIFPDFEHSNWSWDPLAGQYFWHRFYSHQPDLNFDHPPVRRRLLKIVDFWLGLGVDGLRLDAVPYLYARDGTDCENLPETHQFLRELRQLVDERFPGRMLLAETNQWPEDARAYFGDGDECHMVFHFPLMPRLFMGLRMEDRFPILDILQQTPEIPDSSQWALFLRNHDELTLEMVTDEERDYMYRAYANDPAARINVDIPRRLAPLLGHHRQKIELMYGLLLSLPGTPVLYYGDEIGMGDNVFLGDRNGVRTPMQWSGDRNAGFSRANPQRLYLPVVIDPECHYESVNVDAQLDNPDSLLRWVRRLVAIRTRHKVFGRGRIEFVHSENPSVLSFVRRDDESDDCVLVVANLSRFSQYVELDLSGFRSLTPVELFGHTLFPPVGDLPYLVTLSPHAFYWFALQETPSEEHRAPRPAPPELRAPSRLSSMVDGRSRRSFEAALPAMLAGHRWFAAKDRRVQHATVDERIAFGEEGTEIELVIALLAYFEGEPDRYQIPVALLRGGHYDAVARDHPESVLARTNGADGDGALVDAHFLGEYGRLLLGLVAGRRRRRSRAGVQLVGGATSEGVRLLGELLGDPDLVLRVGGTEQSNTSIIAGRPEAERVVAKCYRRLQPGENPELEIGRHLAGGSAPIAPLLGWLALERSGAEPLTLCVVHRYVQNEGDAWATTVRAVGTFLEGAVPSSDAPALAPMPSGGWLEAIGLERDVPGGIASSAELLGRRTAELHAALARHDDNEAFRPERVTPLSQRAFYQSIRNGARRSLGLLRRSLGSVPDSARALGEEVLGAEDAILAIEHRILGVRSGVRIRVHGDLHLGQVLSTGRDVVFVDFEGEPARSFGERRLKRSPLSDVASMLRSYHYAAHTGIGDLRSRGGLGPGATPPDYVEAADLWAFWAGTSFLSGYLAVAREAGLLPETEVELEAALAAQLFDKALYELRYELANRPEWVALPLSGLRFLLAAFRPGAQ